MPPRPLWRRHCPLWYEEQSLYPKEHGHRRHFVAEPYRRDEGLAQYLLVERRRCPSGSMPRGCRDLAQEWPDSSSRHPREDFCPAEHAPLGAEPKCREVLGETREKRR